MTGSLLEKANKLPLLPGVYIMKDNAGKIIYVGKAKKLKNRVTSYFRGEHLPKVAAMVSKVDDFDVVVVNSEFEALILENSLIKQHMPHYNILLKDDKGYPFIRINLKESYPRMSVVNRPKDDQAKYFGPFGGRSTTFDIINTLEKALLLPTCSRKFPRDIGKDRPCLNFQMGLCNGYCRSEASPEEYQRSITQAVMVLSGKTKELRQDLTEKMEAASSNLHFEIAAQYRDRLRALDGLSNRQMVIATAYADVDVIGYFQGYKTCFSVLHYCDGNMVGKEYRIIENPVEEEKEALSNLLIQYYSCRSSFPKTILLPFDLDDVPELEKLFSEKSGHTVHLEIPKRGEKSELSFTACMNAKEEIQRISTEEQRTVTSLDWLQKALRLEKTPHRIEAFDISNLGSTGIVAAMTVFVNGKPLKKDYRKFRIKTVTEQDDYASMYEAVHRRFSRLADKDEGFETAPDLLLIDGGSNHAAVAKKAIMELNLNLPVFGMVKDDKHRTRGLASSDGEEIGIITNQSVFSLIGRIQEETHRFAIKYQRTLRSSTIASSLERIPGVGEKRRNLLLKHFKTIKAISAADIDELASVLPTDIAKNVYDYYHGGDTICE